MESGLLLYDKPVGVTSHDVVAEVRRRNRKLKTGHAGTLDPFATGLLIVLVGRATRVQRYIMELPKTYLVTAQLGAISDTGDLTGEITQTGRFPDLDLPLPTGLIEQRPPRYSAIKIDGQRAYARARRGEEFEVPTRTVNIHRFELLERAETTAQFIIECSSGTYVRSLIEDLGDGYCTELRRLKIGHFDVADSDHERVIPLTESLNFMPQLLLDPETAKKASYGQAVEGEATGNICLLDENGIIAIAEPQGNCLKPIVGFR